MGKGLCLRLLYIVPRTHGPFVSAAHYFKFLLRIISSLYCALFQVSAAHYFMSSKCDITVRVTIAGCCPLTYGTFLQIFNTSFLPDAHKHFAAYPVSRNQLPCISGLALGDTQYDVHSKPLPCPQLWYQQSILTVYITHHVHVWVPDRQSQIYSASSREFLRFISVLRRRQVLSLILVNIVNPCEPQLSTNTRLYGLFSDRKEACSEPFQGSHQV